MPAEKDFQTIQVQAIAFAPLDDFQTTKTVATLLKNHLPLFDGELQSLPLPKDAPVELPRAILQSADSRHRFEVGPQRLNSQWQLQDGETVPFGDIVRRCVEVLNEVASGCRRLALVVTRVCKCENPAEALIKRFCTDDSQKEPFNNSANFEIHNHKLYDFPTIKPKLKVNSWVRCKTAILMSAEDKAIVVQQDLNTLVEEIGQRKFSNEDVIQYFDVARTEADDILAKYFPDRGAI